MDDTGKLRVYTRREYTKGVNCIFFLTCCSIIRRKYRNIFLKDTVFCIFFLKKHMMSYPNNSCH